MNDREDWIADVFLVVSEGNVEVLTDALAEGFDPFTDLRHGDSIITAAASHSEAILARVFELLKTVDIRELAGQSPLQSAAMCNNIPAVQSLLRLGASVEWTRDTGDNILHLVAPERIVSDEVFSLVLPHATVRSLLTYCKGGETPITEAGQNENPDRFVRLCRRYVELSGSLDVRVGLNEMPMRAYVEQAGVFLSR